MMQIKKQSFHQSSHYSKIRKEKSAPLTEEDHIKAVIGYSPQQLKKLGAGAVYAVTHQDDHPTIKAALSTLKVNGRVEVEGRILVNGEYRRFSNRMFLVRDKSGQPLYRDGYVHDITDRKRAEEAARAARDM